MDATQMICDSILESDEEEHEEENEDRGDPLGKLCILKNEHIPEKECFLYLGDNVLGRDPNTCSLPLLSPSVSKQHATISLSLYRRKGGKDDVEALLWDLGSMNGTRKGRLKLTPNVRYALSEGDSLVVADIPCKYIKCTAEAEVRTCVNNNQSTKVPDALRENSGNSNTGKTKSADSGVTQGTPARTSGLTFEQTPTQQQHGSLVPDSESDSDEEKSRAGDRRRKAIVSDSDSYKSSPTCSTFTSPPNKVVPESEDESPITPSSSYKNRTGRVSFNPEESDVDLHRQERKKAAALEIVDDSEEETGNDEAATANNSSAQPGLAKMESNARPEANVVSQFNLDSDTDVEEEEAKLTVAAPPVLSNNAPKFHMDSDTDVEDDETDKPPIVSDGIPKNSQVNPVVQPKGISVDSDTDIKEEGEKLTIAAPSVTSNKASNGPEFNMDSDTDVEDEGLLSAATAKPVGRQTANSTVASEPANPNGFNLDSDTDVEEGETDLNSDVANADGGEAPSRVDARPTVSKPVAPSSLHFDSDTDDEGLLGAAVSKPPVESEKPDMEILSNSDTDVEDDSPEIQPSISKTKVAEPQIDGDAASDVSKSICGQGDGDNPAAVTVDSDTDVKEAEVEDKGDNETPVLQREITPVIQGALQQMCSTPIQQSEGNMEEMETQAFLSPSLSSYRGTVAARKPGPFSPGLDCQDEDLAVAETQPFILNDRGHDAPPEENPNISSDLKSSANEKDVSNTDGGHFQLELSDSSVLRAQALAMESTQAFVNMNLDETQPYADAFPSDARDGPVDIALQATQAYSPQPSSDEEEERDEDQTTGKVDQSVSQSSLERAEDPEEATQPVDFISEAPTQPMCFDQDSDSEDSAPVLCKRKAKQIEEEETRQLTSVAMAETQPMEMMEDGASNEESPVFRKKKAEPIEEEETQPNSDLIETQTLPMEIMEDTASEEDAPVFKKRKAKQLEEEATQAVEIPLDGDSDEEDFVPTFRRRKVKRLEPVEDTQPSQELTVAQTQPLPASETDKSAGEDSARVVRERQTRKQKKCADPELSLAPTQPVVLSEEVSSDEEEEVIPAPRKRKARKLEDTQSLTNSQEDAKEGPSQDEASNVSVRPRRGGARSVKEKQETAEEVSAGPQRRQTRGKSKAAPGSKARRGRAKVEKEDESDTEETETNSKDVEGGQQVKQQDKEMAAKCLKEEEERKREQKEKEEMERLEKERIEKERKELEAKEQKEKEEKERRDREEKERREKDRLEKERIEKELEAKEQKEKEEKERTAREKKELADKRKKEKAEKKQKETAEKRERQEKEQKQREERERLEVAKKAEEELQRREQERKDQEQKARLAMEERLEKEKQEELKKTQEETLRRGRRATRSTGGGTTAAPDSSAAAAVDDGGPAKRTRSRSNSSNSVGSEMSVSSIGSQTSRGRGRGRGGARKTGQVQAEKTPARGRRRTVATAEAPAQSITGTLSRSNSITSHNSEVSVGNVSSQDRGRGGKQRGRGRRTESEAENRVSSQKAPQRGRRSARICSQNDKEDEADKAEPSVSTRGQGVAKDRSAKCTPEKDERELSKEEASTSRRGARKRPAETDAKNESETKTQKENDVDSSITRKTGTRNTQARKSRNAEVPEDDAPPCEKPKGRGRASAVQRKKSEEQGDNSSMEANPKEQEPPQTPRSSVSRKRQSTDSESDHLAKTPRPSSASPRTVGRSRTPSQSYKVLFTGVVDETGEEVLCRLGGSLAKDVADMNCLVTDKVRRTVKFLCAVAKGIPIVTTQWLEKSGKAGTLLAPSGYLVKDREQENKFNFNLHESLRVASDQPLLQGYEIHVTKSVKPEPVHMKDIITSSGAVFLSRMPSSNKPKTVVISCEEDWSLCAPALSSSVPVVCAEFILTGILQQKVDLETHKLSGPAAAPGGRGKGRKKS